jgi:pyridoxal phosphate enzyme (YggS family)
MVEPVSSIDPSRVAENLEAISSRIGELASAAGRAREDVRIVAATKYVPIDLMPSLREGGITLVGENRAQDFAAKQERFGEMFEWDFIGDLQSRKVPGLIGRARLIHSVGSESAIAKFDREGGSDQKVLLQVNIADEESKGGFAPAQLESVIASSTAQIVGLMTMPPLAERADDSRRWFAALRDLAAEHRLEHLSMGTSQDWEAAVSEGATLVRLGSALWN